MQAIYLAIYGEVSEAKAWGRGQRAVVYWDDIKGLGLGLYRDKGKEHGKYYSILGFYRDNGHEKGYCFFMSCCPFLYFLFALAAEVSLLESEYCHAVDPIGDMT